MMYEYCKPGVMETHVPVPTVEVNGGSIRELFDAKQTNPELHGPVIYGAVDK
jgi:hypothetical protein